jgi:hypothetical protein
MTRPPRPFGGTPKVRWQQAIYDAMDELSPQVGPGVYLLDTPRGTHRRLMQGRNRGGADEPSVCELPFVEIGGPFFFNYHFGFWYDSAGELHFHNTVEVEHSGKHWARFTNPFVSTGLKQPLTWYFSGYGGGVELISECLTDDDIDEVLGPVVLSARYPAWTQGSLVLDLGQYVDLYIYPAKRNSGRFYYQDGPVIPPSDATLSYNGTLNYWFYVNDPIRPPGPFPLPY